MVSESKTITDKLFFTTNYDDKALPHNIQGNTNHVFLNKLGGKINVPTMPTTTEVFINLSTDQLTLDKQTTTCTQH